MGAHRRPFTRIIIDGCADRADVWISTNDPHGSGCGCTETARRRTTYSRIGRMTAMDRALSRVALVPASHALTVVVCGLDMTEYC